MYSLQKINADLSQIPSIYKEDEHGTRVETGPLQINEDWPGIFIRGDNAAYLAYTLNSALDNLNDNIQPIQKITLQQFVNLLTSCNVGNLREQNEALSKEEDERLGENVWS
jgi:hypothetical protein